MLASIRRTTSISSAREKPTRASTGIGCGSLENELLRDLRRQTLAEPAADEVQHQVERRRAAGAREPVAVDDEQFVREMNAWKFLEQRGQVFPMDGATIVVEQARRHQRIRAGADTAERDALPGHLVKQRLHAAIDRRADLRAAADDQHVGHTGFFERARRLDRDAVAGTHGHTVGREDRPAVMLRPADIVRHAQDFDRAREGDHRETG